MLKNVASFSPDEILNQPEFLSSSSLWLIPPVFLLASLGYRNLFAMAAVQISQYLGKKNEMNSVLHINFTLKVQTSKSCFVFTKGKHVLERQWNKFLNTKLIERINSQRNHHSVIQEYIIQGKKMNMKINFKIYFLTF